MNMLRYSFLLISIISSLALGASGFGGSEGGPNSKTWTLEIPKGTTAVWPVIKVREGRNLSLNHFCIKDENTLRTLAKYGPKYDVRFDPRTILRVEERKQRYEIADRYFDPSLCSGSWDPYCSEADDYIEENVRVPLYRGEPRATRGGMEDIRDFARRAPLLKEVEVTIPKCSGN